ncbi:hypothetical protein ANAEL_02560 [Anaerolineales bacterium]|nr:hypothetical protein ANAEL_02560 [Anaerolineales bacterium]
MTNTAPPEIKEYTPEQRKLLAKAYRLILSWPREKTKPAETSSCSDESKVTRKTTLLPSMGMASLPENKQG